MTDQLFWQASKEKRFLNLTVGISTKKWSYRTRSIKAIKKGMLAQQKSAFRRKRATPLQYLNEPLFYIRNTLGGPSGGSGIHAVE
jgi:hypothetical protein